MTALLRLDKTIAGIIGCPKMSSIAAYFSRPSVSIIGQVDARRDNIPTWSIFPLGILSYLPSSNMSTTLE